MCSCKSRAAPAETVARSNATRALEHRAVQRASCAVHASAYVASCAEARCAARVPRKISQGCCTRRAAMTRVEGPRDPIPSARRFLEAATSDVDEFLANLREELRAPDGKAKISAAYEEAKKRAARFAPNPAAAALAPIDDGALPENDGGAKGA